MKLTQQELSMVNGGAIKSFAAVVIGGAIIFVMGVASGWKRPLTCKSGK